MAEHGFDRRALVPDYTLRSNDPFAATAMTAPTVPQVAPVLRIVVGRDTAPHPMTEAELGALDDSFARMVLREGLRPMSVDAVMAALDAQSARVNFASVAVPVQRSFLVGEGGQVTLGDAAAGLDRALRFVVARTNPGTEQLILMSVDDQPWSPAGLLQVLSWDDTKHAYNFYQRRNGRWTYAGDGNDALEPPTRGLGPFDGHVNGSLVMKELREPWLHWDSMSASIPPESFGPAHPILAHRLMAELTGAEILEDEIIVPGIDRWTDARLDRAIQGNQITGAETFFRQLTRETSLNIVASDRNVQEVAPGVPVNVPVELFVHREAIAAFYDGVVTRGRVQLDGGMLLQAISELGIGLSDARSGFFEAGETFFVLSVPTPAYEDLSTLVRLVMRGVLSRSMVRAILAVDYTNPIDSPRRAALLRHMPRTGLIGTGPGSCEGQILDNFQTAAALNPGSDEARVLDWLATGDDAAQESRIGTEISAYYEAVKARAQDLDGVRDILRLVVSRRRYFRRFGVSEFPLTFPVSSLPADAPPVRMTPEGTLIEAPELLN